MPNGTFRTSITPDGRFVVFDAASPLLAQDTNGQGDVYMLDRDTSTLQLISVSSAEAQGTEGCGVSSTDGAVTPDGRYVTFTSGAKGLVPEDADDGWDVFVRDTVLGVTERVSSFSGPCTGSAVSSISDDGRFVAFQSDSKALLPPQHRPGPEANIFVYDRTTGVTEWINVPDGGAPGPGTASAAAMISGNGRYVAFPSNQALTPGTVYNLSFYSYLRDRQTSTTELISIGLDGQGGQGGSPTVTADGRFVAFGSTSPNLVPGDTNGVGDVFVRDRQTSQTSRVSVANGSVQSNAESGSFGPSGVTPDGRYVVFDSRASNLVAGDTAQCPVRIPPFPIPFVLSCRDIFVRDLLSQRTVRISVSSAGVEGNKDSIAGSITEDGLTVVFESAASNLVPVDGNGRTDAFLRYRGSLSGSTPCTVPPNPPPFCA